jgi:hypothetical protein
MAAHYFACSWLMCGLSVSSASDCALTVVNFWHQRVNEMFGTLGNSSYGTIVDRTVWASLV